MRSPRLGFRQWLASDLELAADLWGDGEVTALIGGPFGPAEVRARFDAERASLARDGVQYWPIFSLQDGEHVGCCGLRARAPEPLTLELGFHILHRHWRRGFATEAARRVIRYAFEDIGAAALFAGHNPENHDSGRILGKLGFRHTHDELYEPTGLMHPSYLLRRDDSPSAP